MTSPKTYKGYNSEGSCIVTVTAVDANEYINPEEVQAAIDNVGSVAEEQMNTVSKALQGIEDDASEAVIVQGTKMDEVIDELASALGEVASSIKDSLSDMYTQSVKRHDELQQDANDDAYNQAKNTANVVSVS